MVDLGAHVGYFSLLAARAAGPEGFVFSVEPDPVNFAVLVENVRINALENVYLLNSAAWDKNELLIFHPNGALGQINPAGIPDEHHRIGTKPGAENATVYGRALDEKIGHLEIDLIKIDVQGAEARALEGMPKAVARAKSIIIEIWPAGLRQFGNTPRDITRAISAAGFDLYACTKEAPRAEAFDFFNLGPAGDHIEIYATKDPGPLPWQKQSQAAPDRASTGARNAVPAFFQMGRANGRMQTNGGQNGII